ncbi:ribosomal protein L7/L12 [Fimbriiglobus ruber]|uniref:ribosomal protein L7/L12 n=1 Tax=Fimbriiglobus ruber TaxID=1908690 RepID=UPI000B4B13F3|nr:ribosomal protein L7/L12 [Fimbriiglobus ruber]
MTSEEEGFLKAIRSNPADDLGRLVYTDWLEERGDDRARYLRLLVSTATRLRENQSCLRAVTRLYKLSETLNAEWREAVGKRYDLVLDSVRPDSVDITIDAVRGITGLGLDASRRLVRGTPSVIRKSLFLEDAYRLKGRLEFDLPPPALRGGAIKLNEKAYCQVSLEESVTPTERH